MRHDRRASARTIPSNVRGTSCPQRTKRKSGHPRPRDRGGPNVPRPPPESSALESTSAIFCGLRPVSGLRLRYTVWATIRVGTRPCSHSSSSRRAPSCPRQPCCSSRSSGGRRDRGRSQPRAARRARPPLRELGAVPALARDPRSPGKLTTRRPGRGAHRARPAPWLSPRRRPTASGPRSRRRPRRWRSRSRAGRQRGNGRAP